MKLIRLFSLGVFFTSLSLITIFPQLANAQVAQPSAEIKKCELTDNVFGLPTWYKYLDTTIDDSGRCSPQLSGTEEQQVNGFVLIGLAVLEMMIRIAGLVAVVMIFIGAFRFITTQGSPDKAAAARKTVINAIIGLVIVILATTIVNFVGNSLTT